MSRAVETQVLIVGAGPVGLTLAADHKFSAHLLQVRRARGR